MRYVQYVGVIMCCGNVGRPLLLQGVGDMFSFLLHINRNIAHSKLDCLFSLFLAQQRRSWGEGIFRYLQSLRVLIPILECASWWRSGLAVSSCPLQSHEVMMQGFNKNLGVVFLGGESFYKNLALGVVETDHLWSISAVVIKELLEAYKRLGVILFDTYLLYIMLLNLLAWANNKAWNPFTYWYSYL